LVGSTSKHSKNHTAHINPPNYIYIYISVALSNHAQSVSDLPNHANGKGTNLRGVYTIIKQSANATSQ